MIDRRSKALWEGHVLCPQGRRDTAPAEGWTAGPGCPSERTESAGGHPLHPWEPPSTGRLGAGPQDTGVTKELVQCDTQQNATAPDHAMTPRNPGWVADWISMNTRVRLCCSMVQGRESSVQLLSRVQLCNPMGSSTPGLPVHHQLPELAQTQVHRVGNAIQPSHPLSSPSPPAFNLSQHQGLFK